MRFNLYLFLMGAILVCAFAGCNFANEGLPAMLSLCKASGIAILCIGGLIGIVSMRRPRLMTWDDHLDAYARVAHGAENPGGRRTPTLEEVRGMVPGGSVVS